MNRIGFIMFVTVLAVFASSQVGAVRLKDMSSLKGVRVNQLIGYGLIVGLNGTGDGSGTEFTIQSLASMLRNLGIGVDATQIKVKNVAAIIATAQLPPFGRAGSRIDVMVSSLGDSKSLEGGTLLMTPLKAPNGDVYAVAQGPISIGGFSAASGGASVQKNHPTVGKVTNGALIEKEIPFDFTTMKNLSYALNNPDFTTATRMVQMINQSLGGTYASARDSATIVIDIPENFREHLVDLVATVENLSVVPDTVAKIVVNERTGSVVIGQDVRISTVAVSHGSLSITITPNYGVSQPNAFAKGETVVVNEPKIEAKEGKGQIVLVPEGISIGDLVKALNAMGVTPRDLIAIFQAIKAAGALQADLEII